MPQIHRRVACDKYIIDGKETKAQGDRNTKESSGMFQKKKHLGLDGRNPSRIYGQNMATRTFNMSKNMVILQAICLKVLEDI